MKRLIRVKAVVVPLVEGGQAGFGAVCNHKEPVGANLEHLDVVGLGDLSHFNVLELVEAALIIVKLVNVRTSEELSHDDKHLILDDNRLAAHNRLT